MTAVSCVQNDGRIGDWFGTWRLESITIDGTPAPDYAPPYLIWKFQSSVIQILQPDDVEHTAGYCIGTWEQVDKDLRLNFTWHIGTPPDVTLLAPESNLEILKLTGGEIHLRYITSDGRTVLYVLKKWG